MAIDVYKELWIVNNSVAIHILQEAVLFIYYLWIALSAGTPSQQQKQKHDRPQNIIHYLIVLSKIFSSTKKPTEVGSFLWFTSALFNK